MALHGLTKIIRRYSHQENGTKALASLLSSHIKRCYSTKDPKRITNIPQNPEDCGCIRLPKLKSSKSKQKTSKKDDCDESKQEKHHKEKKDHCKQPPVVDDCEQKAKEKEAECAKQCEEVKETECEDVKETECVELKEPKCEEVKEKKCEEVKKPKCEEVKKPKCEVKKPKCEEVKKPKCEEVKKPKCEEVKKPKCEEVKKPKCEEVKKPDCEVEKEHECDEPKGKQMDCVEPQPKDYPPDCSKLKNAHICKHQEKVRNECKSSQQKKEKPKGKLGECCQMKEEKQEKAVCESHKKDCECGQEKLNKTDFKATHKGCSSKSTAMYCAKLLSERKAGEIQSCSDTTKTQEKPKTKPCVLGKKDKSSKPCCKHKQKEKEPCSSAKPATQCVKEPTVKLQKTNVRTINPCDPCHKPKGCTDKGRNRNEETGGNMLKIIGIPAVILAILGIIYQCAIPPPPPPST